LERGENKICDLALRLSSFVYIEVKLYNTMHELEHGQSIIIIMDCCNTKQAHHKTT